MTNRYLIEVEHDATPEACARVVRLFLDTGSHFLSRADWGCKDGEHKAWIILEVDSKEDALRVIPPTLRAGATVVQLNTFTVDDLPAMLSQHEGDA